MNWKSRENEPVKKKKKSVELKILISVILFISIAGAFVFIFITSRGGEKPITKPIKATDKEASSGLSTYTVPKIDPARITEYKDTSINVIAVSNDNKLVAVGGTADVILIWNIETGKLQHKLVGHRREILKLSFSPDNEKLLSFAEDKKLILWDLKTGKPVKSFVLKRVYNAPVAFSPDFKQFCYLGYRYFLNIYRIKDGSKIASFKVPGYYSGSIKYSTDGKYIAFRLRDSKQYRIAVINVSEYSHKLLRYIALEYDTDIKFSKTNTFLYAISDDNNVVKYNYKNNTFMERILNKNAKYTIKAFDIHEKKGLIAYTQFNNVIIADLKSGRNIRIFKQPGYTYTKAVKFSRDGNYVYIAKKNYVVGVINLKNKKIQYYSPPQS
jgi:WD40 repeat protein